MTETEIIAELKKHWSVAILCGEGGNACAVALLDIGARSCPVAGVLADLTHEFAWDDDPFMKKYGHRHSILTQAPTLLEALEKALWLSKENG